MNAISSHRPFGESKEADYNQRMAFSTWISVFSHIVFFGETQPIPAQFIPCDGKPFIKDMATLASKLPGWTAIINADIQLEPQTVDLPLHLGKVDANCAYSFRIPIGKDKPEDMGLDFFLAKPFVWEQAARLIPKEFRIGCIQWDTWMVSFFVNQFRCFDISPLKLVYHPTHGERNDQSVTVDQKNWYLNHVKMAKKLIL